MIGALLAAALAANPCEAPERALDRFAGQDRSAFEETLAELEKDQGAPLLSPGERQGDLAEARALVRARLVADCALRGAPSPAAAPDRAGLEEILSRPEFRHARDRHNVLAELWVRLTEWFFSLMALRTAQAMSQGARALVLGLACLVVVAAALRLRAVRRRSGRGGPVPREPGLALEDPGVHLAVARAALPADPRGAIRQALLALLSRLERRRWARPDRAKTNRELTAELPKRGAPAEVISRVAALTGWFDLAFYSLEPVLESDARGFVERVSALDRNLEERVGALDATLEERP